MERTWQDSWARIALLEIRQAVHHIWQPTYRIRESFADQMHGTSLYYLYVKSMSEGL